MCQSRTDRQSLLCELVSNHTINSDTFTLTVKWDGTAPKAGQFFMIRPVRSCVYLPRPISIFEYYPSQALVKFLIAKVGRGTDELSHLKPGEKIRLTGPFGNAWEDFITQDIRSSGAKIGLAGGSAGVAPLAALVAQMPDFNFSFLPVLKTVFPTAKKKLQLWAARKKQKTCIDGRRRQ